MATIGVKIELEGAPQYKENMSNLTAQTKLYQAQLKRLEQELSTGASAFKKSRTEAKALEQQLQAQMNQSKLLEEQIAKTSEKYGEDSTQVIRLKTQYEKLQTEISKTSEALKENGGLAGAVGKQFEEVGNKINAVGQKISSIGDQMTAKLTAPIVALGGVAVHAAADFESAMSNVAATMGYTVEELNDSSSQAAKTMEKLEKFAQDAVKGTAFSATEAAEALNYMALAGYDAETSMSMLPTVLNLAAAGEIDLAEASDMVTDTQSALGLTVEETATLVDQMAKASSKSNTSVAQLGEALLTIGATAANVNGGTAELATTLGVLADNGIKGAEGGTHLRNMILSLQDAAVDGAVDFGEFSVQVYDSEGNFREVSEIMQDLASNMNGMSQESKDAIVTGIFNKTDLASVNALLGTSSERFDELKASIEGAEGAAEEMAAVKLENFNGKIKRLKLAFESAAISIGNVLIPYITKLVEKIEAAVEWFDSLSDSQKDLIVKIALVVAAIGPVLSGIGRVTSGVGSLVTHVGQFSTFLGTTFIPFVKTTLIPAIAGIAAPFIAIAAVIGTVVAAFVTLWNTNEEFRNSITTIFEEIKTTFADFANGIVERINALGFNFSSFTEVVKTIWTNFCNFLAPVFELVFATIQTILETVLGVLTGLFDVFSGLFTGNWSLMWQGIQEIFSSIFTGIINFFLNWKNMFVQYLGNLLTAIKTKVTTKLTEVKTVITEKLAEFKQAFVDLKDAALDWGKDLIQNFIDGIKEKWESLKQTVSDVAQTVKDFLGFSEPSKGPLSDFHTYGPDMMKSYSEGIKNAQYLVKDAVAEVAADVGVLQNPFSLDDLYEAVRSGASDAAISLAIGDREFTRALREMGVQFDG